MKKYVYFFGDDGAEGNGKMKALLGGKGAGLAEMCRIGLPVPPGYTITTEVCNIWNANKCHLPAHIIKEFATSQKKLERIMGRKLGDSKKPLFVSVRSGAQFSMPGMMDTVLNLGLNDVSVVSLSEETGNKRFAYDAYRRFISMFGSVVMGINRKVFESVLVNVKKDAGVKYDYELTPDQLKKLIELYKDLIKKNTGRLFPQDAYLQLSMARDAVFRSWNNERAIYYRKLHNIPETLGTAVNVQAMVFGNMGENSLTGVGFTRNPATGENEFYGEYLINAQGEDVVAGIRTPQPIKSMKKDMPEVYESLKFYTKKLEKHYRDIQDFEFTVERGKLYMLQTRTGKRTAQSAVKIAVDMVREGLITKNEALLRVEPESLSQLLHPIIDPKAGGTIIARGLPASPGASGGCVVFTADEAVRWASDGKKVILVRSETSPDDIHGMDVANGILTAHGGMTSHAAVVARGMGKCCIVGCEEIRIDESNEIFHAGNITVKKGDVITLDGHTGRVLLGNVNTVLPELKEEFALFIKWANDVRSLGVRANADTPRDTRTAIKFGAEGIGLCRTEHMFFSEERLPYVQQMIIYAGEVKKLEDEISAKRGENTQVVKNIEERLKEASYKYKEALNKIQSYQKEDFKELFREMRGMPVTIRTLDPPLHEFLPKTREECEELSKKISVDVDKIWARIMELHEINPMLGHRGCRVGITYPEITEMQARAIIEAACEIAEEGKAVIPEIMIPLVGDVGELKEQKKIIESVAEEVFKKMRRKVKYSIGTMIEVPRAAITADEIAGVADFFSFGTNDLTQMTYGFSRDDAGKIITYYLKKGILPIDPFTTIDKSGVGELMNISVNKGRKKKPELKIGICGEHGGEPESVKFCHSLGIDYVSCSPYRVPVAILAAAQSCIKKKTKYTTK